MCPALVVAILVSLLSGAPALAQGDQPTPGATPEAAGTPRPPAEPTLASPSSLQGTVAAISGTDVTVRTASGELETISVPATTPVVRNGRPATLDAILATERIVVQRDDEGEVLSLFVISPPPTRPPAPAGTATPGAPPAGATVPAPATSPTPAGNVVTGSVTAVNAGVLTVGTDSGETREIDTAQAPGLTVTRDGAPASAADIRTGDFVTITYGTGNQPVRIEAGTEPESPAGESGLGLGWIAYLVGLVLPLLALFLLVLSILWKRRNAPPAEPRVR